MFLSHTFLRGIRSDLILQIDGVAGSRLFKEESSHHVSDDLKRRSSHHVSDDVKRSLVTMFQMI